MKKKWVTLLFVQLAESTHTRATLRELVAFFFLAAAIYGRESGCTNGNVPENEAIVIRIIIADNVSGQQLCMVVSLATSRTVSRANTGAQRVTDPPLNHPC